MAARILFIMNGHLCRDPRPLKEAETLSRVGYDVTVVGVRNNSACAEDDRVLFKACHRPASNS